MSGRAGPQGAVEWLASAAPDPAACRRAWESNPLGVTLLPAGRLWDVLIVSSALGHPALDVLTGCLDQPGPVLADFGDSRVGFFVPPGTASRWLGTGVRCAGQGTWVVVPYPGRATGGTRWLVPPDGRGTLNDPVVVEMALHEAAARIAGHEDDGGARGFNDG
ncbi:MULTISPECIES: hypothetical protein [unclassified Streptomyces]|uniref:hypothetical protein n=1 Tax=unclassified Streptomyces TaxID=2593676 RepID=UPI002DDC425A|nr:MULTISPECIES: hypothetical protein [unclassified Streptomyces]WSB76436.1 hypothetical protein OHB04_11975 [Streptomyces sp. NBC_01775]WSS15289.1 hypothetical protein OG533_27940 [Streptomyces sp. NBC_01186]WSS44132.1 hypothetical protein OG220_28745 [Streptomyces sp. NBC_01187]